MGTEGPTSLLAPHDATAADGRRPLAGKVVIVTGAGSGIGKGIALEAATQGAHLLLVGRRAGLLDETVTDCRGLGGEAVAVRADVTQASAGAMVVQAAVHAYGRLDGLVNNAGLARFASLEDTCDRDVRAMFEVNLLAPLRLVREAATGLRATQGSVVNVSSIGGQVATPNRCAYGALKAALNHLTRSLARELAPDIRVNAVLPGPVLTPMYADLGLPAASVEDLRGDLLHTTPAGRFGEAVDVARWVCALLDDRSSWVTGSLLTIDGGRSC